MFGGAYWGREYWGLEYWGNGDFMPTALSGPDPYTPGGVVYSGFSLDDLGIDGSITPTSVFVFVQRNGVDETGAQWVASSSQGSGRRYAVTGVVPASYSAGDTVCLWVKLSIGGEDQYYRFDMFVIKDQSLANVLASFYHMGAAVRAFAGL